LALHQLFRCRIIASVAVKNCVKGKPTAAGISRRPWTTKPRPKKEDRDLSQWPKGTTQPLTKVMASKLFSLISTSDDSMRGLLSKHPEFPPFRDLSRWRRTVPWFAAGWKLAKQMQAEWLMQIALDLQKNATRETAHLVRVRFDILRHIANKLHPEVWGERPAAAPNISTRVQVAVTPERIADLRSRLEATRAWFSQQDGAKAKPKNLLPPRSDDPSIPG
jgi:hypothetical protein